MAQPDVVFYSWQSDSNKNLNRHFIEVCLRDAIKKLNREGLSEIVIDRDTKDVAGMPDIGHTILEKISKSAVVVADLSIINPEAVRRPDETPVSNPNVLFELGYAYGVLGPKAMVGVFNTASGDIEELPFDIRPKRLMTYHLGPNDSKAVVRARLVGDLADALTQSLGETKQDANARNVEILNIYSDLWVFASEIDDWHGINTLSKNIAGQFTRVKKLPKLLSDGGFQYSVQSIVDNLERASVSTLNQENWPDIKRWISEAGEESKLFFSWFGLKIDKAWHDNLVGSILQAPAKLDGFVERFGEGKFSRSELEVLSYDLRMSAFHNLIPEHPKFSLGFLDVSLDLRRLVLRWAIQMPEEAAAIAAIQDIRDRLLSLITKYPTLLNVGGTTTEKVP